MPKLSDNIWEQVARKVGQSVAKEIPVLADRIRGGKLPPGSFEKPKALQLDEYLLLARPVADLAPEEVGHADELWQAIYSQQDEVTLKKWAMAMEAERLKLIKPTQGVNNAKP